MKINNSQNISFYKPGGYYEYGLTEIILQHLPEISRADYKINFFNKASNYCVPIEGALTMIFFHSDSFTG